MRQLPKKDIKSCSFGCQAAYEACMHSKEHETVCPMKNNQCTCGCKVA